MLKMTAAMLLAGAVCANASAQVVSDAQFGNSVNSILSRSKPAVKALSQSAAKDTAQRASVNRLESVLTAMNDLPGTGSLLVRWLRDHNAAVEFNPLATRQGGSASGDVKAKNGNPAVYIDPVLAAASPKLLGVLIARETTKLMPFEDSAEKQYLIASRMAETYFELGGTRAELAALGRSASADIRLWIENAPDAGVARLAAEGDTPLTKLYAQVRDQRQEEINMGYYGNQDAMLAWMNRIQKSIDEFGEFKKAEKEWLLTYGNLLH